MVYLRFLSMVLVPFAAAGQVNQQNPETESTRATPDEQWSLVGQVFDPIGSGVKDVEVIVESIAEDGGESTVLARTTTDGMGDFSASGPGGSRTVRVTFRKSGYADAVEVVEATDATSEYPAFVGVQLEGDARLVGKVLDAAHTQPVVGASVRIRAIYRDWNATADADGKFELSGLPPGGGKVLIDADGFAREIRQVADFADPAEFIALLKPDRIVKLTITDEDGHPVAGAAVEAGNAATRDMRSGSTDEKGLCVVRGLPEDLLELQLRLTHDDYVSSVEFDRTLALPKGKRESSHTVTMQTAGTLVGTVTDADTGQVQPTARVSVGEYQSEALPREWTDYDGTYTIPGITPGRAVVTVHLVGYAPQLQTIEIAGRSKTQLDFALQPATTLSGTVVDDQGKPVVDAYVIAEQWRGFHTLGLRGLTDERGTFVILDAPTDEFDITVFARGYEALPAQTVRWDASPHRLELATAPEQAYSAPAGGKVKVGEPAPDIDVVTLDGRKIKLSELKGKTVLLDFWATWCGPCVAEMPNLLAVHKKYGDRKDFLLLGITLDFEEKALRGFLDKQKIPWPQVFGEKGNAEKAADAYGVMAVPATFLIDPEGNVTAMHLRGPQLDSAIADLLGTSAN
ncbi:MAG: carboxypeptidase regulatory-like domain-containing protein [Planctomycetes bacterium]|nr:carboxypeptidase regulatory-like domain-containing protein [Planctomycetota bacterium]